MPYQGLPLATFNITDDIDLAANYGLDLIALSR
jgi:hypothetical protein